MKVRSTAQSRARQAFRRTGLAVGVLVLVAAGDATVSSASSASNTVARNGHAAPSSPTGHGADGGTPPPWAAPMAAVPVVEPVAVKVDVGRSVATRQPRAAELTPAEPNRKSSIYGIPTVVLAGYERAVMRLDASEPGCAIPVALVAAIGKVESGHADGGRVDRNGTALRPILGPVLDGSAGTAAIPDTDHGALDGSGTWDRAVGPMQFIPSTWDGWASDGNGDGITDPENVYDASLAAARYLCADGRDLSTSAGIEAAILSYNDSMAYLAVVETWMVTYGASMVAVADSSTPDQAADISGTSATIPVTPGSTPRSPSSTSSPRPPATTTAADPAPVTSPPPTTTPPVTTIPTTTPPVTTTPTTTPPVTTTPTTTPPVTPPPVTTMPAPTPPVTPPPLTPPPVTPVSVTPPPTTTPPTGQPVPTQITGTPTAGASPSSGTRSCSARHRFGGTSFCRKLPIDTTY
jgi:membrane-bound lytic murein transglycosylase B